MADASVLSVRNLRTAFQTPTGDAIVVDGISFDVRPGRTTALVGESGCGKSVTALSILRLLPNPPARILDGQCMLNLASRHLENARPRRISRKTGTLPEPGAVDLMTLTERQMQTVRGGLVGMVFQEPMTALHPAFTVGEQIVEALELHEALGRRQALKRARELLEAVGIPDPARRAGDYPHQLSGGMRQRAMIAIAIACEPALLIADEPTTALDVTIQAQILHLLRARQHETGMGVLLITHDLGVVAQYADDLYVMYAGRIVEYGLVSQVFAQPLHPYTKGLLKSTPRVASQSANLEVIPGQVPTRLARPSGCAFHPRCALTAELALDPSRHRLPLHGASAGDRSPPETARASHAVLRRCVESFADEPSGDPPLRACGESHRVACWEA